MAITFDKALGIHEPALRLRSERAVVLANNLANAETPNYKARDLNFRALLSGEIERRDQGMDLATTRAGHIQGGVSIQNDAGLQYRVPLQPGVDGNTVEEQVEHAAYMKNALDFQFSFQRLNSKFKGLTSALKGE